ncbi:MAG: hypothetical protein B7Z38_01810 [Rhodobacterales bacterium 12-64-8]|nr:MAG: hypothetical protein B7Z38_01810 [Rhodobacterales bacterium 12-64-8]OYX47940.1 MAG: hypothetical protein B7Y90_12105 [Alphaproteobacteria bacterium 32-64-14]
MSWLTFREELSKKVTPALCADVRHLRVEKDESWRGVSRDIFNYPSSAVIADHTDMSGDQPLGMFLCELCAEMLGENPNAEPWN